MLKYSTKEILLKYRVIRPNTNIKIGAKTYKTGDEFEAKKEDVQSLLENKYIKGVKNGKSINS